MNATIGKHIIHRTDNSNEQGSSLNDDHEISKADIVFDLKDFLSMFLVAAAAL